MNFSHGHENEINRANVCVVATIIGFKKIENLCKCKTGNVISSGDKNPFVRNNHFYDGEYMCMMNIYKKCVHMS